MLYKKQLTKEQALQKLKHFCGYQERCHAEVHEKLYDLGIKKRERDEIVAMLIEEGYLNEERFAITFAGGKFRVKQWGRVKIRHELKQKQVSDYCIKKALQQIDQADYETVLKKLAAKKMAALKPEQPLARKKKLLDYLLQKGFEPDLATRTIDEL